MRYARARRAKCRPERACRSRRRQRIGAVNRRFERTDGVVFDFGAHEAADLHTGLRARNVIKAVAVKGADFDVLYRLGLDRHLRRPRAAYGDDCGDAARAKAFSCPREPPKHRVAFMVRCFRRAIAITTAPVSLCARSARPRKYSTVVNLLDEKFSLNVV